MMAQIDAVVANAREAATAAALSHKHLNSYVFRFQAAGEGQETPSEAALVLPVSRSGMPPAWYIADETFVFAQKPTCIADFL
mmetsp:Transcript_105311/g.241460  ORF Transcript_105311/g.241460 Transcript_105311/m.241460 type:complete len:82 (-) Transcript_105311:52-297(-)